MKNMLTEVENELETAEAIREKLKEIEIELKELISHSLVEIKKNPSFENEIIQSWIKYIQNLDEYIFEETERTNSKNVYKSIIKTMIFKKF